MKQSKRVLRLCLGAVVAALYAVLSYLAATVNLAYGALQFRFSEALTVLPVVTPAAIPGLALGCLISNLASPLGIIDWIFGTTATLLAAVCTRVAAKFEIKGVPWLAPLPPVLANAAIVGFEVSCLTDAGFSLAGFSWAAFGAGAVTVGVGELVVCYALGLPLLMALKKIEKRHKIFV